MGMINLWSLPTAALIWMTEQEGVNCFGFTGYCHHFLSSFYTEAGWGGLPSCFRHIEIIMEWI